MFWLIFVLFLSAPSNANQLASAEATEEQLKVCGNFCGPSWCGAKAVTEASCVSSGAWNSVTSGTCADACCKSHDYCCGKGTDRASCNKAIVNCLAASNCYWTVCGATVWAAMKAVSNWCCGGKCPMSLINEVEARLNITGQLVAAIANISGF